MVEGCRAVAGDRVDVEANLRIARGLDYYTGTVVEIFMEGYERLKSVGGGGRYDALASDGRTTYPGVGVSFGVSRTLIPLIADGVLAGSRARAQRRARRAQHRGRPRPRSTAVAAALRARDIACEVAPTPAKFGKQIRFAERRGIPYVWFVQARRRRSQVKDIRTGEQVDADPATWTPPEADLRPRIISTVSTPQHIRGEPVIRTHDAGALRAEHVGQTVTLAGWVARRRDHGGVAFLDLREASGVVQVVVRDEAVAHSLRSEYCLKVTGEVVARKAGNENPNLATGDDRGRRHRRVEVLSTSDPLPFPIDDASGHKGGEVGEEARLKHRYLDLRRSGPNAALRLRSKINKAARDVLDERDFVEVETPTLTRSTPEGARDFLVPARLAPGSWYALPQSPQLFKQLLMVGGMERYYQIARCYRDEDFRADRQPEFTQLDIEMSFVDQEDVITLMEDVLEAMWAQAGHTIERPLPRMTYADAMARFGSDKPDLRMGLELVECTDYFKDTTFRVFQARLRRRRRHARRRQPAAPPVRRVAGLGQAARRQGPGVRHGRRGRRARADRSPRTSPTPSARASPPTSAPQPGDCIFFAAGPAKSSRALLGAARLEIGRRGGLLDDSTFAFTWVVDAPLFEPSSDAVASGDVAVGAGAWTAVHHAFTSPKPEFVDTFDTDPGSALAYAYDIVCNGNELGGGSIRIHRGDIQKRVFSVMGLDEEEAQEKFGFLLDAFKFGAPAARRHRRGHGPHRGAARRHRLDPRRDRLPEVRRRLRPAHGGARAHHAGAAQGSRCRRPAREGRPARGVISARFPHRRAVNAS